jgi:hypothetical protein
MHDTESITERRGQHTGAGRRAYQGKGTNGDLNRSSGGALSDHDIKLKILHSRIENLLYHAGQAVDLVDEEDIFVLERRQDSGEVSWSLNSGA